MMQRAPEPSPHESSAFPARPLLDRYREVVDDWDAFLRANHTPEKGTLRFRGTPAEVHETLSRLTEEGFTLEQVAGLPDYHRILEAPRSPAQTLDYWLGGFHMQQVVMGLPALALAPVPGERVLDLCAAPGGKTVHLADLMDQRGPLVAVDPKEKRLRGLLSNVFRLGVSNVLVIASDGRELPGAALFDRVLVDAPCSAEGNYRRQRGRLPARTIAFSRYVTDLQFALLKRGIELTRPGGTVVYSTCTFAPEENEAIVARALEELPVELERIPIEVPHAPGLPEWKRKSFSPAMSHAWRVYPHHLDSGGMFMARLRVLGEPRDPDLLDAPWGPVPCGFPGEDEAAADTRVADAARELGERYQLAEPGALGWMVRGDTIWAHTIGEWPVEAWLREAPRGWRVVSLGIRGTRADSKGRETPANQLLQRFGHLLPAERQVHLSRQELIALLTGGSVERPDAPPGPLGLFYLGRPLGRGMMGFGGLRSEIQASQAARLLALLREEEE